MKILKTLLVLFLSQSIFAVSIGHFWNDNYEKKVTMTCSINEDECRNFCGSDQDCTFTEKVCRNCLGSSVQMSYIFTEMGRLYRSSGLELSYDHIYDLVRSKKFVTLSAKSIYNQVTKFNALSMRRRFRLLCEDAREPLVFFHTNSSGKVIGPAYVACDNKVFELIHDPSGTVHGTVRL